MLNPDIIVPYTGTHASIPAGWSRETSFDNKYVKATSSDWGNTGGSATHSHTSPSHTHTYSSNSHTHTTGTIGSPNNIIKTDAQHQDSPPQDVSTDTHYHSSQTSGVMASNTISAAVASVGNANNEYSRYHFIFIKSVGWNFFPANSIILRDDTESRAGSTHFDSSDARYMKGANTNSDAGNATDVATHNHTQSHTHTLTHGHGSVNSGGVTSGLLGGKDVGSSSPGNHSHTVSFNNHQEDVSNSTAVPNFTNALAYKELHFWKATTAVVPKPGDIALFTGSILPVGWIDLELDGVYVKGKATGQALTTGGALTHTHTVISHSHAGSSHTHVWSTSSEGGSNVYRNGGSTSIVGSHIHSGTTSAGTNSSTDSSDVSFSTDNYEPTYIKVRFIQMQFSAIGGSLLTMLL